VSPPESDITVVVPAWGPYSGRPLEEALASVREQDLAARVIVVDNVSDHSLKGEDVIRTQRRLTVGAARNFGLQHVETPYVLFWDADDLMLQGTLRILRDRMAERPELVAVAGSILEDAPRVRHRFPRRWAGSLARRRRLFAFAHAIWSLFPTTGCTLIRTSAARDAGGFPDSHGGDDWVLGVSLAFRGQIEILERPGRIYRRLGASLWGGGRSQRELFRRAALVRRRIRSDPGVPSWERLLLPLTALLQLGAIAIHSAPGRLG
jgi:glycosyltransferase involved in cell wall biosynthesis